MELINRPEKMYAPPATLKAYEPEWDIRASYQSSHKDQECLFFVRSQQVSPMDIIRHDRGRSYRLCFINGNEQWVNEGNIRKRKVHNFPHLGDKHGKS